jgi:hypothetical protein
LAALHQIRIAAGDRQKTAFTTTFGLYEWRVFSFGLTNAPSQFMRMMDGLLTPEMRHFVALYLDDILIHSGSLEEHVQHVRCVLNVLLGKGLRVKRSKCEWAQEGVQFCGFTISGEGIHTQQHKTAVVRDWLKVDRTDNGHPTPSGTHQSLGNFRCHRGHCGPPT